MAIPTSQTPPTDNSNQNPPAPAAPPVPSGYRPPETPGQPPPPTANVQTVEELPPALTPDDLAPPPKAGAPVSTPTPMPSESIAKSPVQQAPRPEATASASTELPPKPTPDTTISQAPPAPLAPPPVPPNYKPPDALKSPAAPAPKVTSGAVIRRSGTSPLPKIVLGFLLFLIGAGAVFFFFFYRVTLNINISNQPDQILLDGKPIQAGVKKVMPAEHSLVISKQGYISYRIDKKFAIGEKLDLSFALKPQTEAQTLAAGGRLCSASIDQKYINYVSADNHLAAVPVTDSVQSAVPTVLSVGAFNGLKQVLFSQTNTFALVLDAEALKLIDLKKTDILDQVIAKLPPDPKLISSITWNATKSQFVSEANEKVLYDLKTASLWNIILSNRTHTQSEILMELEGNTFSNISLDWGLSPKNILLAGGELGIIDVSARTYQTIDKEKNIHFATWGPNGTYALAIGGDKTVYLLKNLTTMESLNYKSDAGKVAFISEKEGLIISDGRPVRINFDTGEVTSYAEIKGLDGAKSIAVASGNLYFADQEGLKTAALTENVYGQ